MRISDFDYQLPEELIAQHPLTQRDDSRMMIVDRATGTWKDSRFSAFSDYLRPNDVLVLNNTRVFPARLRGTRVPSGGSIELLLLHEVEPRVWEALARPARRLRKGTRLSFGESELHAEVIESLNDGRRLLRFESNGDLGGLIDQLGEPPLPPYIKRETDSSEDRERYQTIYAKERGAIAAPTAGLHFTARSLRDIEARGIPIVEVTLHVGYGTFEPVRVNDISRHRVAPERISITVESSLTPPGRISACSEQYATVTIVPGYRFGAVDVLLTNFHLPRSSLLMLVSAFADRDLILAAYRHAVAQGYRFYSYGDCMLIV